MTKKKSISIGVGGMTCASCVAHVEKALKGVDGVDDARVNLATNNATIDFDPSFASPAVLEKAIADAGYEPVPLASLTGGDVSQNATWLRELLAGRGDVAHRSAVALNVSQRVSGGAGVWWRVKL